MNYSSYLGSKKCNNVICTQGPTGPPGPPGESFNNFTIISSDGQPDEIIQDRIVWYIDIPFIYGRQFTFSFHTIGINVIPTNIITPQELTASFSYIFGLGQAVYQNYTINNTSPIYYGYIPIVYSYQGIDTNLSFNISSIVDNNGNIIYFFYYDYDPSSGSNYENLIGSKIQLNGIKYY